MSRGENGRRLIPAAGRLRFSRFSVVQRPVLRRWRRCTATIENPAPIRTRPMAIVQRRSKPVNGSVLAFVPVVGVVLVLAGAVSFAAALFSFAAALFSFDGEVPVLGVGVVAGVGVVPVVGGGGVWL
jgi:hypothetical protein